MECSGGLAVFGEARTATNRRRPSAAVEDEDNGVEAKQSFPRGLACSGTAGVRASMETMTPCTGGAMVSIYVFYKSSRTQRRHARDQMATGASSAMSLCGGVLSGKRGAAAMAC